MAESTDLIIAQLTRLEDELSRLEDFLIYGDKGFQAISAKLNHAESSIQDLYQRLLEIESKVAKLECKTSRQHENTELRQFVEFIHGFPLGWTGLWWMFVVTVAVIDVLLDWASLTKILNKFFGFN